MNSAAAVLNRSAGRLEEVTRTIHHLRSSSVRLNEHQPHRLPDLDALRGIAAMSVLLWHISTELPGNAGIDSDGLRRALGFAGHGGALGVMFFFLLSGYLITWRLLLQPVRDRAGLGRFYLRRVLRTWPLYYVAVLMGFVIVPCLAMQLSVPFRETASPLRYALFLPNIDMLHHGAPVASPLTVLWSVGIEEQFYLLWPLVLALPRRWSIALIVSLVLASIALAALMPLRWSYFHLWGNLRYLGFGALLGFAAHRYPQRLGAWIDAMPRAVRRAALLIGPLLLGLALTRWFEVVPYTRRTLTFAALFFGYVLLERSLGDARAGRLDRIRALRWLGERSYGLYIWHMPALSVAAWATAGRANRFGLSALLTIVLSCALADASLRWIERPFLRLKRHFGGAPAPLHTLP